MGPASLRLNFGDTAPRRAPSNTKWRSPAVTRHAAPLLPLASRDRRREALAPLGGPCGAHFLPKMVIVLLGCAVRVRPEGLAGGALMRRALTAAAAYARGDAS